MPGATLPAHGGAAAGIGHLYATRSLDEGRTWLPPVLAGSQPIQMFFDPETGNEYPQPGFPSAAVGPDGTVLDRLRRQHADLDFEPLGRPAEQVEHLVGPAPLLCHHDALGLLDYWHGLQPGLEEFTGGGKRGLGALYAFLRGGERCLRLGGRFAGWLHSVEAELTGELVPEGAVLGSQAGNLGAGDIEPLAERADACAFPRCAVSVAAGGSCLRRSEGGPGVRGAAPPK